MIKGQLLGIPNWLKKKVEKNSANIAAVNGKLINPTNNGGDYDERIDMGQNVDKTFTVTHDCVAWFQLRSISVAEQSRVYVNGLPTLETYSKNSTYVYVGHALRLNAGDEVRVVGSCDTILIKYLNTSLDLDNEPLWYPDELMEKVDRNSANIAIMNSKLTKMHIASGTCVDFGGAAYGADITLPDEINFNENVYGVTVSYINTITGENLCDTSMGLVVTGSNTIRIVCAHSGYVGLTVKARILYVDPSASNDGSLGVPGDLMEKVEAINSKIEANNLEPFIDISSYTSDMFECPSDGYFSLGISYGTSNRAAAVIYGHDKENGFSFSVSPTQQAGMVNSIFVKKGMYIKIDNGSVGLAVARFTALA